MLEFLRREATYFHLMTVRWWLIAVYADLLEGRRELDGVQRLRALVAQDPVDWILATPIALALRHAD